MQDVLIVGGGPAGLTAAIYAARSGLSVLVAERQFAGGQMTSTGDIVNYPGFESITGPDLSMRMEAQARTLGADLVPRGVKKLNLTPGALSATVGAEDVAVRAMILAMGAQRRRLNIPGEEAMVGRGVSYCAVCDGGFFKNENVAIVGGGNTALEDALYLSAVCAHVTLIHRRDSFRGGKRLEEALRAAANVTLMLEAVPMAIRGSQRVEALQVKHVRTDEVQELPVSAVFVAVGTVPESDLVHGWLPLDGEGRVTAGEDGSTEIPGVFVAGDLRKKSLYQIVSACADGAAAANAAAAFLFE